MTIRVYGNILYSTGVWGRTDDTSAARPLTEEDIYGWIKDCADHGATSILWQSNCGGTSTHPSPIFPLPGQPLRLPNEAWAPAWDFLGEQVRRFDTLNVGIAAAHEHGLRFTYALCPWDFVDSPFEESVFHSNLWMLSRKGEPFVGVPCYAELTVQQLMLKHVRDVLDRGVDDLAISFFAHTQGGGVDQPNYYGFNAPLMQAYRERYPADPLRETFDPAARHALYGDFYTEFLRRLHQETRQRDQRLIPCTTYDGRDGQWGLGGTGGRQVLDYYNEGGPAPTVAPGCSIDLQWRRWAEEGIADALLVWAPPPDAVRLAEAASREVGRPVLLWRKVVPAASPERWAGYHREAAEVGTQELVGYVVHAMVTVNYADYTEKLWGLLAAADSGGA